MLARLRSWWARRSMPERVIVAIGVPVAAIAALWGARRDRARGEAAAEGLDAEGGSGAEAAITVAGQGPAVINAGVPGLSAGELASFSESFTGEIGLLERRFTDFEESFGDTAAERAQREAEREAAIDDRFADLEGELERAVSRPPATKPPRGGSAGPDAEIRRRITQEFTKRNLAPPGSTRMARLVSEVKGGRTYADIGAALDRHIASRNGSGSGSSGSSTRTYTVKRGDTLSAIGSRFGIPWRQIYDLNRSVIGADPDLIKPGQVLKIPAG